jgi:hypothetical protein
LISCISQKPRSLNSNHCSKMVTGQVVIGAWFFSRHCICQQRMIDSCCHLVTFSNCALRTIHQSSSAQRFRPAIAVMSAHVCLQLFTVSNWITRGWQTHCLLGIDLIVPIFIDRLTLGYVTRRERVGDRRSPSLSIGNSATNSNTLTV